MRRKAQIILKNFFFIDNWSLIIEYSFVSSLSGEISDWIIFMKGEVPQINIISKVTIITANWTPQQEMMKEYDILNKEKWAHKLLYTTFLAI